MSDTATQALVVATEAKQQITSHEKDCAAQWARANEQMNWILRTLIITLLAVVGSFLGPLLFK